MFAWILAVGSLFAAPAPAGGCPFGIESRGASALVEGKPESDYEAGASLSWTGVGGILVFKDEVQQKVLLLRLGPEGKLLKRTVVALPDEKDRYHVRAAVSENRVAIASTVYRTDQDPEIEVSMTDLDGRLLWHTHVDPKPLLDTDPVLAFGGGELGVAWLRGTYPSASSVRLARLDPATGKTLALYEISADGSPAGPVLAWDGQAFLLAWSEGHGSANPKRPGIFLSRLEPEGKPTLAGIVVQGPATNPDLTPSPQGLGLVFDVERSYGDAVGEGTGVFFVLLGRDGKASAGPVKISVHPDPMAAPRKARMVWNGEVFGIVFEVYFSASVFVVAEPEIWAATVDPVGKVTAAMRVGGKESGLVPAIAWTGNEFIATFVRGALSQEQNPSIFVDRLPCRTQSKVEHPSLSPGPCDLRRRPIEGLFATPPEKSSLAIIPAGAGVWAGLRVSFDRQRTQASFLLFNDWGKPIQSERPLPSGGEPFFANLATREGGFVVAWTTREEKVEVLLLRSDGTVETGPIALETKGSGAPAVVSTPKGIVVAFSKKNHLGHTGQLWTALLDRRGKILRAPKLQDWHVRPTGDCALGLGKETLGLVFTSPAETSETNLVHFLRLDLEGNAAGQAALISEPYTFLRSPVVIEKAEGRFAVVAADAFVRNLGEIEVDQDGKILVAEHALLKTYGLLGFTVVREEGKPVVFGVDQKELVVQPICDKP